MGGQTGTKVLLHLLNALDLAMGLALVGGGFFIMVKYSHSFADL
jgi:hypothetical protein